MPATLADSLQLVRQHIPEALVSPPLWSRLEQLAARLPFNFQVGFEARLGEGQSQADLAQAFSHEPGLRQVLAAYARQAQPGEDWAWSRIGQFSERWADPADDLHEQVSHVWLEYDLPDGLNAVGPLPAPGVFIALPEMPNASAARLSVLETVIGLLGAEAPLLTTLRQRLQSSFQCLPPGALIYTLGVMPSRGLRAARLPVHHLQPDQVGRFLQQMGWPGELNEIQRLVDRYARLADRIALDLDVGESIWPHLGLELHLGSAAFGGPPWQRLLDQLVEDNLCSQPKREALLHWPGVQTTATEAMRWPQHLLLEGLRRGLDGHWTVLRQLNHIKLFYQPGQALIAKAYWGYLIEWVTRGPSAVEPVSVPGV